MNIEDVLPQGTFMADISPEQVKGMIYSIEQGLRLRQEMPWIADAFKAGASINRISDVLRKKGLVNGTKRTVIGSVTYALKGYDGNNLSSRIAPYDGFFDQEEYNDLWNQHNRGTTREMGRKFGRTNGLNALEKKTGIHAQTPEERLEAIRLGLIAQGKLPWKEEEIRDCFELSQKPEYRKGESRTNWIEISRKVNEKYHGGKNVRSNRAVAKAALRHKENLSDSQ
jgi:hypothetical protein